MVRLLFLFLFLLVVIFCTKIVVFISKGPRKKGKEEMSY